MGRDNAMFNYDDSARTTACRSARGRHVQRVRILACLAVALLVVPVSGADESASTISAADGTTELLSVVSPAALVLRDGQLLQPVRLMIRHAGNPVGAEVRLGDKLSQQIQLHAGSQECELFLPQVSQEQTVNVELIADARSVSSQQVTLRPVRQLTVYIVPHSHTDIGYTEIQTDIETKQVNNLLQGMEYARKTADYPEGAAVCLEC